MVADYSKWSQTNLNIYQYNVWKVHYIQNYTVYRHDKSRRVLEHEENTCIQIIHYRTQHANGG